VKVSIVVPAFNEERLLASTLESIRQASGIFRARGWECEVIVCDNNSTDHTAEIARQSGATVVSEPVNQISRARNTGAANAKGDWLIFVDADSRPSPNLFAAAADAMQDGHCIGGGATVAFDTSDRIARFWLVLWNSFSRLMTWGAGSFVFCDAWAFRALGGFSQSFYAGEEIDFFRRLKRLARRERRSVVILHRHPLLTSDRKVRLYKWHEHLVFLLRTLFSAGRTLHKREECFVWYDGRR
jgi:glycosyltransferase involved in cell wall biosynthesis